MQTMAIFHKPNPKNNLHARRTPCRIGTPLALNHDMRVGITTSEDRVSPVFGVAREVLIVDYEDERETHQALHLFGQAGSAERIRHLKSLDVDVLICGAITVGHLELLRSAGIRVIDQARGRIGDVLRTFVEQELVGHRKPGAK